MKYVIPLICGSLLLCFGLPAHAHDKCDSLAMATTAGGVLWGPVAGFQVGYFLAKQIDESTKQYQDPDDYMGCDDLTLDVDTYLALFEGVESSNPSIHEDFKFVWDGAGDLIERSRAVGVAVAAWNTARERLLLAEMAGDVARQEQYTKAMNSAHARGMVAFTKYRAEHFRFAFTLGKASNFLAESADMIDYVPMTVEDVVASAKEIVDGNLPAYERRYLRDIACLDSSIINADGVLAPAARFLRDDVPPGTFISDEDLVSLERMYTASSLTFRTEVVNNLDDLLPADFVANERLAWDDPNAPDVDSGRGCVVGDTGGPRWLAMIMLALGLGLGYRRLLAKHSP